MKHTNKMVFTPLKAPKAFFDWCESRFPIYQWENTRKVIISTERTNGKIEVKRLTKKSRLTFENFKPFAIVLVSQKRIEIQTHAFFQELDDGKEKMSHRLINVELFKDDKHHKLGSYGGKENPAFYEGMIPIYSPMGGPYQDVVFYDNNFMEKLKKNVNLKYLDLPAYRKENFQGRVAFARYDLDVYYRYHMEIEYCQKINAKQIELDIITRHCDFRMVNQKWLKKHKARIKNSRKSFNDVYVESKLGGKLVDGILDYVSPYNAIRLPKNIGQIKLQNWIIKNKADVTMYCDYLDMYKDMGVELDTLDMILPKDLARAHDRALNLYLIWLDEREEPTPIKGGSKNLKEYRAKAIEERDSRERAEKKKELWKTILGKLKQLNTTIDGYAFVTPKEIKELIEEGKALHHCVASYVDRMSRGETTIIFVRDVNNVGTPLYTLELRNGEFIQCRGTCNTKPKASALEVVTKYVNWVNDNQLAS